MFYNCQILFYELVSELTQLNFCLTILNYPLAAITLYNWYYLIKCSSFHVWAGPGGFNGGCVPSDRQRKREWLACWRRITWDAVQGRGGGGGLACFTSSQQQNLNHWADVTNLKLSLTIRKTSFLCVPVPNICFMIRTVLKRWFLSAGWLAVSDVTLKKKKEAISFKV